MDDHKSGITSSTFETQFKPEIHVWTFEELLQKDGYIVFTNEGKSMLPLLRQYKDIIEIRKKPACRCKKYDVVLYKTNEKYTLHRILKVRSTDYIIAGDNCIKREYGITDKQILGIMTRVIRDGKIINVTDWKYLIYVHLWCDFFYIRIALLFIRKKAASLRRLLSP